MTRIRRIDLSDLGEPRSLDLGREQVVELADRWRKRLNEAWADVEILAQEFLWCGESDGLNARRAWHHLLMAVGNFKRSAGMITAPFHLSKHVGNTHEQRPVRCKIPVPMGIETLSRDDALTWPNLTMTKGLRAPTATTLLSALWPDFHVIIDRTAMRAVLGVSAGLLWDAGTREHAELPSRETADYWKFYESWYRPVVIATAAAANVAPSTVERALFVVDKPTIRKLKALDRPWIWSDYRYAAGLDTIPNGEC